MAIVVKPEVPEIDDIGKAMDENLEVTKFASYCVGEWLTVNEYLESIGFVLSVDNEVTIIPLLTRIKAAIAAKKDEL